MQTQIKQAIETLKKKLQPEEILNLYPLIHTNIATMQNIQVSGIFRTNDSSDRGMLSYVTVGRDIGDEEDTFDPAGGIGFAWKKSALPKAASAASDYNIYLVDNNILTKDFFVNPKTIVQDTGENAFLKASNEFEILVDTDYNFELKLTHHPHSENAVRVAIELRIWEGSTRPETPLLSVGPYEPRSQGPYFGISVLGTKGSEWFYDDLQIRALTGTHALQLFRFKPSEAIFSEASTTFKYFGYGRDGVSYGVLAYIWNPLTSEWEEVGFSSSESGNRILANPDISFTHLDMLGDYADGEGFVNFLLLNETSSSEDDAFVNTYYTSLEKDVAEGLHAGGHADIYVNDPTNIIISTTPTITIPVSREVNLADHITLPLHTILSVELTTGETLDPTEDDWWLMSPNPGLIYSTRENPVIHFAEFMHGTDRPLEGEQIKIAYRYYSQGEALQEFAESNENSLLGIDNLIKMYPPVIISFNKFDYMGNVSPQVVRNIIQAYVNNATKDVNLSQLISELSTVGVSYVNLSNLDVKAIEYNEKREIVSSQQIVNFYQLPEFRVFYTDRWELTNVTNPI